MSRTKELVGAIKSEKDSAVTKKLIAVNLAEKGSTTEHVAETGRDATHGPNLA